MTQINVPHFRHPFRFVNDGGVVRADVVEQDEEDEIITCVQSIVMYTIGERIEKPEFGIHDPAFSSPSLDDIGITDAVHRWEPRAVPTLRQSPDPSDELITRAIIAIRSNRTGVRDV